MMPFFLADTDGSHILSIQGEGFSVPHVQNYAVTVGGRPCAVISVLLEEVRETG